MEAKVGKYKAENVEVTDSGGYFSETNVESILQEIKCKIIDDGTYNILQVGAIKILKVRKSDGQLFLGGGVTTDATL